MRRVSTSTGKEGAYHAKVTLNMGLNQVCEACEIRVTSEALE